MLAIGSRGSQLALWQANYIRERLEARGAECRIEIIKTTGDRIQDAPLNKIGGKGLFTKEIEEALLDRRIDLAVHSMKDLPTELPKGLTLAAIPQRAEPYDAIVGGKLRNLKVGAIVGTSSLRRIAQLKRLRPDLNIRPIRGNIDTRINKVERGEYDAIVLAAAGLQRLGWGEIISESFRPDIMCPAVGQGALAIETLESGAGYDAAAPLDDPWTRLPVTAERAMLLELGGGCQVPIGAFGSLDNTELFLTGAVFAPDGSRMIRYTATGECTKPAELGRSVAEVLLKRGAGALLDDAYAADGAADET
ncbi:MAG TPA: hydroxymethylbilane synthase [Bryobacteraceae bacterium]|jgi:hydroxymethylbilane synthase|nr:hydroxymethylbilane synthase [Bryobacteraceae bacterium]